MFAIAKKEIHQFFSNLTGYLTLGLFLIVSALVVFVFRDSNVFDFGYATLAGFFDLAPWIFIFLIPALCMRSLSDEFKTGTFETLKTRPLTNGQIVWGKYLAVLLIVLIALLPTMLYLVAIQSLAAGEGIDVGAHIGSYIGLFLLGAVFTAISIWCSSLTSNAVVSFLLSAFFCILFYFGFGAISELPFFTGNADYYIEMLGIDFHYQSMSRGVIDSRDVIYFFSLIGLFLWATQINLYKK